MRSALGCLAQARDHPAGSAGWIAAIAYRAGHLLRRLWRAYWLYQTRRAAVLMLHALDDRTLEDIGLSRSQVVLAVYGSDGRASRIPTGRPHDDEAAA